MSLKALGLLLPVAVGGVWLTGAFGGGYNRVVDRTPAQVIYALQDLDIGAQPGSPGTDASRSGGIRPVIRTEHTDHSVTWTVMSGDRVATRMTALLEPVDEGRHTRVTAEVERGDAPDDFVSPAFRSRGVTMGLFVMALESELNDLVAPLAGNPERCRELMEQFAASNEASARGHEPKNLSQAMGNGARTAIRLSAMEAELRRQGCDMDSGNGRFRPVSNTMGSGGSSHGGSSRNSRINFEPGQPMVDVSRDRHHRRY